MAGPKSGKDRNSLRKGRRIRDVDPIDLGPLIQILEALSNVSEKYRGTSLKSASYTLPARALNALLM